MAEPATITDEFWQKLARQGPARIIFPEEEGGSGLGLVDLIVLKKQMGWGVMRRPFLSTALLGELHQGWAPLSRVIARATVALSAEMCGGAQQVLDLTVAYARIRVAFWQTDRELSGRQAPGCRYVGGAREREVADLLRRLGVRPGARRSAACAVSSCARRAR